MNESVTDVSVRKEKRHFRKMEIGDITSCLLERYIHQCEMIRDGQYDMGYI